MANVEFNSYLTDEAGWADYTAEFNIGNTSPSATPTYEDIGNGLYLPNFAEGDIAFINFHIQHDILVGSKLYPHVHFAPSTTMSAGETVIWEVGYTKADRSLGETIAGTLTTLTLTYTADGTEVAHEHLVVEVADIDAPTTSNVDSMFMTKIVRGNGTYAGDVYGITADLHYQVGRISTPNKAYPFV